MAPMIPERLRVLIPVVSNSSVDLEFWLLRVQQSLYWRFGSLYSCSLRGYFRPVVLTTALRRGFSGSDIWHFANSDLFKEWLNTSSHLDALSAAPPLVLLIHNQDRITYLNDSNLVTIDTSLHSLTSCRHTSKTNHRIQNIQRHSEGTVKTKRPANSNRWAKQRLWYNQLTPLQENPKLSR